MKKRREQSDTIREEGRINKLSVCEPSETGAEGEPDERIGRLIYLDRRLGRRRGF